MKIKYTFDEICESQEFEHGQEFLPKEKVTGFLNMISESLLPFSSIGQIEFIRRSIDESIKQLEKK
jgi:hypothetical protein